MKAPVFLTLAALAAASPLVAQSAPASLTGKMDGDFRDFGIVQLVAASDALLDPASLPPPPCHPAPDASRCDADSLIFCEINTLAPSESFCAPARASAEPIFTPVATQSVLKNKPVLAAASGALVACSESGAATVVPTLQPVLAGATPIPAEQVPEPSAILLVIGAAAWILLRKKQ